MKPLPCCLAQSLIVGAVLVALSAMAAIGFFTARAVVDANRAAVAALPYTLRTPDQVFQYLGYRAADIPTKRDTVPRVYLQSLPQMLPLVRDHKQRKQLFLSIILPHILAENERIQATRRNLETIKDKVDLGLGVTGSDLDDLAILGAAYGLDPDVALTLTVGPPLDIEELYRRIDIVPPDLALAQAAIESGWGTSRFALTGNALFGQWSWDDDGIIPLDRRSGARHRINAFNNLSEAVAAYMRNLNTHDAYETLRQVRAEARSRGKPLTGALLAPTLSLYSERRDHYVKDIKTMIRSNRLDRLSQARLERTEIKR